MRLLFFTLLLGVSLIQPASAQISYRVTSHNPTPEAYRYLLLSNTAIEANDTINEKILDLVNPMVTDSVLGRKKEHHQLFLVGWLIHAFGDYNWRAIDMVKKKFVGTVRETARSGGFEYSEWDINFDLNFHLEKYLRQTFYCYDCQKKIHRQNFPDKRHRKHKTNYDGPPFVRDTNNINIAQYRLHCELTPPPNFIPQLNYLFFPTLPGGGDVSTHPNFRSEHPSMGFYGASCLDCNHNCHPELHPYEWAWWMNLHTGDEQAKTWNIGLFYEGSNRFKHWSHNPKTGTTTIPFAFEIKDNGHQPSIEIEHLVFNAFVDSNLRKLHLPDTLIDTKQQKLVVNIKDDNGKIFPINISFNNALPTEGLKYWFSNVNWDEKSHILSGYLNMGLSVKDVYTARITFRE
jgi:hypothetical protein